MSAGVEHTSGELAKQILAQVILELPPTDGEVSGKIVTGAFLATLARSWPHPLNDTGRRGLDALCRKLAVTKQMKRSYDPSWKRALSQEQLEAPYWAALMAVLLAPFQPGSEKPEQHLGDGLKRINAAFEAIDIAQALPGVLHLDQLASWAEARLTETLG